MTNCSLSKIILEHMDINKERDDRKREEKEEQEEEFDSEEEVENSNNFVSSHFSLSDTAKKVCRVHCLSKLSDSLSVFTI